MTNLNSVPWPPYSGDAPAAVDPDAALASSAVSELWNDDWYQWDLCRLGPYLLPGLARVKPSTGRKIDMTSPPGSDGGNLTDKGYEGGTIEIELTMWLKEHRDQIMQILPALEPKQKTKDKKPWDIAHASTAMRQIKSVYIRKIDGPVLGSIKGTKVITFHCVEWFPPVKKSTASKTTKPTKSSAVSGGMTPIAYGGVSPSNANYSSADGSAASSLASTPTSSAPMSTESASYSPSPSMSGPNPYRDGAT
jgi:hypothetical protein